MLQQHLPFTVLKQLQFFDLHYFLLFLVATAPTVYGIETLGSYALLRYGFQLQQHLPFTVLKLSMPDIL